MRPSGFLAKTSALAIKDLRVELRGRDTLPPMLAFAFTVALVLAFAVPELPATARPTKLTVALAYVEAGFLWITVLFAGLIGFARTFEVEREEGAIDALLLAPVDRSGLFIAKAAANLVFVACVEAVVVPSLALFFAIDLGAGWLPLLGVIVLVDLGFVAAGTLFAAVAAQTRSRELLLPLLALPTLVPVFIAAIELTADLFLGAAFDDMAGRGWFAILLAFDVIYGVVAALTFELALD
ncbi:MAG: heme exporter protein CcmB [Actinobacteria bacterium]|nr:heme exporter protein CcmB [Actinomycetota bacterium]